MSEKDIEIHPDYYDGFFAAIDAEPLPDDATPEFEMGWRAGEEHKRNHKPAGAPQ